MGLERECRRLLWYVLSCLVSVCSTTVPYSRGCAFPLLFFYMSWVGEKLTFLFFYPQIMCGVSTATFGGAVRDVTLNRPIRILHSHAELYATTAAAGASAYMLARSAGAPPWARIWAGVCTSIAARYVSWSYGVRLPTWETGAFAVRPPMKLDSPLAALEPGTATEVCERSLLGAAGGGAEGGEKK